MGGCSLRGGPESALNRREASVLARNPEFGQEGGEEGGMTVWAGGGVRDGRTVLGREARGAPLLCICRLLATQHGKADQPVLQMRRLRPEEGKGLAQGHARAGI